MCEDFRKTGWRPKKKIPVDVLRPVASGPSFHRQIGRRVLNEPAGLDEFEILKEPGRAFFFH